MTLKTFFKECNEKDVFKRLSIYIVSSWVIIQVLAVTWDPLGLPKVSVTYLIIALLIGLPVYLYFIWKYRLAPLEKLKEPRISKQGKPKKSGFQKMYFSAFGLITLVILVVVAFIIENVFFESVRLPEKISTDKIAILEFGNNTGDPKNDIYGKMTSDWIMHGITQHQLGQVVSPEIVNEYIGFLQVSNEATNDKAVLSSYFKPGKVISGNYYLKDDKLLFQCSITDGDYDKTLISFDPVSCDRQNPLECVEALKQVILGFLITEVNPELNLQETPPRFEAYEYFINAKANYANEEVYLDLLNKAIEADSTYFEAKVDRVLFYYNAGEFRIADSLIGRIIPNSMNSTRQINLLNQNKALLNGNNKKAYTHLQQEYNYAPFHLETNSGAMVVTLQYVNKPEKIDSLFNFIPMEKMNLETCTFCKFRYYIQGLALNELKQYNKTQQLLAPVIEQSEDYYLKIPLIAALVRSGNFPKLDDLLNRIHLTADGATLSAASLFAGKECLLKGDTEKASLYFDKVLANEILEIATVEMASAYYYKKDFDEVVPILEKLMHDDPENHSLLSKLAVSYAKIGNQEKSDDMLKRLEKSRSDYQYGSVDYAYAQFFAATGNKDKALQHLLLSIANGNSYTPNTYQNDPHFKAYHDNQAFKNILTFWH